MNRNGAVLGAGALLGVVGNVLVRSGGAPGLNLLIWAIALAVATVVVHRRAGGVLSSEARIMIAVGLASAIVLVWRDAPPLKLLAIWLTALAFWLPAFRSGAAWIRSSRVSDILAALAGAAAHGAGGAAVALAEADWGEWRGAQRAGRWQQATAAARGVLLALPLVVTFGALLIAADAVFAEIVTTALRVDLETLMSHLLLTGFFAWAATGYIRGFVRGSRPPVQLPSPVHEVRVGGIEAGVVLGLLNALFLAFVIVQFRYLFGGDTQVEITPGLTYADYARRGFFELVLLAALVVPLLLLGDWLLRDATARARHVYRGLAAVHVLLVLAIGVSALHRMLLYQAMYGLTEARLYTTAVLLLIAATLLLLTGTVLRGRPHTFAPATLACAVVAAFALFALNPDAVIARTNLDRAELSDATVPAVDASYLAGLSGDALPVILSRLSTLPDSAQCVIADRTLKRWEGELDLRNWSWSAARAQRLVHERAPELARIRASCDRAAD
jgi:hypothetical protein